AAQLLRDVSGSARTAGRIEDDVTRISRHEDATLHNQFVGLNDVLLIACTDRIGPCEVQLRALVIRQFHYVSEAIPLRLKPVCPEQPHELLLGRWIALSFRWLPNTTPER